MHQTQLARTRLEYALQAAVMQFTFHAIACRGTIDHYIVSLARPLGDTCTRRSDGGYHIASDSVSERLHELAPRLPAPHLAAYTYATGDARQCGFSVAAATSSERSRGSARLRRRSP